MNMNIGYSLLTNHSNNPAYASSKLCKFIQVMTISVFKFSHTLIFP